MGKNKVVCVDFDGTCVMHEYPKIGAEVPHAVSVLKRLNENQVKIILWTIRSGEFLQEAVDWFVERDVEIWAVNKNPQQRFWSKSPKAYAHVYVDDASINCPLIYPENGGRPYANWCLIEEILRDRGYIND